VGTFPGMGGDWSNIALRRCVLAVSVLNDVDLVPDDAGVTLDGAPAITVGWDEIRIAIGEAHPETRAASDLLAGWLRQRRWIADRPHAELRELARPIGFAVGDERHPGELWVREHVLGNALDLGIGLLGLDPERPDAVAVVPPALLDAAGAHPSLWWHDARRYLDRMGELAVQRWRTRSEDVVRPLGDCDVVTLLGSAAFRAALVEQAGGMRQVVVPMRTRGWLDVSRIDPAFAIAAAAASDPADRGFPRSLLVTRDEVVMVRPGGRPHEIVLRDPATPQPQHMRPVLYR
jgi:hypothetical protein